MDAADTRASPEKEEVICMRSITVQRLAEFTEQDYEFTFGITRKEFAQMLEALNAAYCKEHRRRPHFTKITMQDKLVLTLLYRREYRSMENIAPCIAAGFGGGTQQCTLNFGPKNSKMKLYVS